MYIDIHNTDKQYNIIYADPPWSYNDKLGGRSDMGATPYPQMSQDELNALPIPQLVKKDSILFMWATMPKLQEVLDTIKAWGFKYKTCAFCWVKQNPSGVGIYSGLGHWVNGNAELCSKGIGKGCYQDYGVLTDVLNILTECQCYLNGVCQKV